MELRTVSLPVTSEAGECKIVPTGKMHLLFVQVLLVFSECVPVVSEWLDTIKEYVSYYLTLKHYT